MDDHLIERVFHRLSGWPRTMILSHDRPDGDALGAMAAMKRLIESAGREATAFVYGEIPPRYHFLQAACGFSLWNPEPATDIDARFDGILICDTCSWSQLEPVADFLRSSSLPKIIIDHHATRDDLSARQSDDLYMIDPTAASTCGILFDCCERADWAIDAIVGEALFTGLATDTGWFRFSNTDARTLRIAATLIERGVKPDSMHARLFASYSPQRLRLKAEMLATLQLHADGAVAMMHLTKDMFDRSGASQSDTEDLVNEPLFTGTVIVSVLLTDLHDGKVRINLRSKSPEITGRDVDVAALAGQFGGGGHRRAAAARVTGTLDEVRKQVITAITKMLD